MHSAGAGRGAEPDYRFTLANERTYLAWQRTALGLLAASVAVIQFLPESTHPFWRYGIGLALGIIAVVVAISGLIRWRQNDRAIRQGRPLPHSNLVVLLASVLALLGVLVVIGGAVVWLVE